MPGALILKFVRDIDGYIGVEEHMLDDLGC
jgi:hypothetical protein